MDRRQFIESGAATVLAALLGVKPSDDNFAPEGWDLAKRLELRAGNGRGVWNNVSAPEKDRVLFWLNMPEGTREGDRLMMIVAADNGASIQTPFGWDFVERDDRHEFQAVTFCARAPRWRGAEPLAVEVVVHGSLHVAAVVVCMREGEPPQKDPWLGELPSGNTKFKGVPVHVVGVCTVSA